MAELTKVIGARTVNLPVTSIVKVRKKIIMNKINSKNYKYLLLNDSIEDYEDLLTEGQIKKINTAVGRINDKLPRITRLDSDFFGIGDGVHNKILANEKLQSNETERKQIIEYIDKQIAVINSVFKEVENAENDKNTLVVSRLVERVATRVNTPSAEDLDIPEPKESEPEEDEPKTRGTEPHHRTPQEPASQTSDLAIMPTNNTTSEAKETNDKNNQEDQSKDKRKKIIVYTGIGVGAIILLIVIFKLIKRKK